MSERGKIIVKKANNNDLIFEVLFIASNKTMTVPKAFDLKDQSLNDKECDVERHDGQIVKITVNGTEYFKKQENTQKETKNHRPIKSIKNSVNNTYKSKDITNKKETKESHSSHPKNANSSDDLFNISKTLLPTSTIKKLSELSDVDNYHLKLNKAAFFDVQVDKKFNMHSIAYIDNINITIPDNLKNKIVIETKGNKKKLIVKQCLTEDEKRGLLPLNNKLEQAVNNSKFINKINLPEKLKSKLNCKQTEDNNIEINNLLWLTEADKFELLKLSEHNEFKKAINDIFTQLKKKKFELFKVEKKGKVLNIKPNYGNLNFDNIIQRQKNSITKMGFDFKEFVSSVNWRLIIGLGNESVYKTSMTLHHIYGIPYIPANSIKGVVRSWVINNCFGQEKGNLDLAGAEKRALEDPGFKDIFGTNKVQGKVIFFDAFPVKAPVIEPDIMNPHYGPYYSDKSGNTPPADYYNPNPIPFLTVGAGTEFQFYIGLKNKHKNEIGDSKLIKDSLGNSINGLDKKSPLLDVTEYWFINALAEHGVGAKTAVGYGYFQETNKQTS